MKILKAKNYPEDIKQEIIEFNVSELILTPPIYWLEKRMDAYGYGESFEKHGMLYPISVSTHNPKWVKDRIMPKNPHHVENGDLKPGLYVHTGNKRVLWAKKNGYEKIEGYLIDEMEDRNKIKTTTTIPHKDIPK